MFNIIDDNKIKINNKLIEFPSSIMKDPDGEPFIVESNNLIIVNFYGGNMDNLSNDTLNTNIWAFDKDGNLKWKIEPSPIKANTCNPYASVFEKDGKIYGGNLCGYDFEINTKDGSVKSNVKGRPW